MNKKIFAEKLKDEISKFNNNSYEALINNPDQVNSIIDGQSIIFSDEKLKKLLLHDNYGYQAISMCMAKYFEKFLLHSIENRSDKKSAFLSWANKLIILRNTLNPTQSIVDLMLDLFSIYKKSNNITNNDDKTIISIFNNEKNNFVKYIWKTSSARDAQYHIFIGIMFGSVESAKQIKEFNLIDEEEQVNANNLMDEITKKLIEKYRFVKNISIKDVKQSGSGKQEKVVHFWRQNKGWDWEYLDNILK